MTRGKSERQNSQLQTKEITSREDLDIRDTDGYEDEMDGFEVLSHGIDFEFGNQAYRIYVGLKRGTIYFKKGSVSEDLVAHIQGVVTSL